MITLCSTWNNAQAQASFKPFIHALSTNKVFKQCSCPGIGLSDASCAQEMTRESNSLATAETVEAVYDLKTVGCKLVITLYRLTMCHMKAKSACNRT